MPIHVAHKMHSVNLHVYLHPFPTDGHSDFWRAKIVKRVQMLCNREMNSAARRNDISSKLVQLRVDIAALRAPIDQCTTKVASKNSSRMHQTSESAFLRSVDAFLMAMDAHAHAHDTDTDYIKS